MHNSSHLEEPQPSQVKRATKFHVFCQVFHLHSSFQGLISENNYLLKMWQILDKGNLVSSPIVQEINLYLILFCNTSLNSTDQNVAFRVVLKGEIDVHMWLVCY